MNEATLENGQTLGTWLDSRRVQLLERYTARDEGRDPRVLVRCGIPELESLGVPELGTLIILAGHSGDGKSSLALQFIEGAAKCGYDCQAYMFEDPAEFTTDRFIAKITGLSAVKLRRMDTLWRAPEVDRRLKAAIAENAPWAERIRMWGNKFATHDLFANIEANMTPETGLIVVDYAQVFGAEDDEASTERVINRLAFGLNELAKKYNVAIILLSQVDTKGITRRGQVGVRDWRFGKKGEEPDRDAIDGFRPSQGDLAWAAALGQKARAVLVVFRPAVWLRCVGVSIPDDTIEIHVVKNNFGEAPDPAILDWDGATTTISSRRKKVRANESL